MQLKGALYKRILIINFI